MSDCSKFAMGSRSREICDGLSSLSLKKTNLFREKHGIVPLTESEAEKISAEVSSRSRDGKTASFSSCGSCGKRAIAGPVAPSKDRSQPTEARSKKTLVQKISNFGSAIVSHIADGSEKTSAEDAIFRESLCRECPFNSTGECLLCGCPLWENTFTDGKISWRSESCPTGRWFRQGDIKFNASQAKKNLLFHIYPKIGGEWNWKWHIEKIRENASVFNGKICIGIATGDGLAKPDVVQNEMKDLNVGDWVIKPNSQSLCETTTFYDLLSCVSRPDGPEITFRGHTKGVTHPKDCVEQKWKELMWQTCMDMQSVTDALSSHVMAGSMKCHEPLAKKDKSNWFYAGTFFWFRSSDIFSRDWSFIEETKWWPEYWPGHVCRSEEAACLCHDFAKGSKFSYEYWNKVIVRDWEDWKHARGIS